MSLNPNFVQRSISPLNSGTSSPIASRQQILDNIEVSLIKTNKAYRRYASIVERVLSLFDSALEEWADYISFLGRLLKALQNRPEGITNIPHRGLVAKRLSQCLNPSLPPGVHQKALEVYGYIFSILGRDGISAGLPIYLPGITPVLSFGSLTVKPEVLNLFEKYILDIDPGSRRPALKAIILALLPGLEEESSEEFERVQNILSTIKDHASDEEERLPNQQYFWQCFFLASITSSSRRLGALAFLSRHLPRSSPSVTAQAKSSSVNGARHLEEKDTINYPVETICSPDSGLLIRCFCAGLNDSQLLVQRGFLDLLVTHLPLHSDIFVSRTIESDLAKLVGAATSVVSRRDMSLNRRLWAWFLGPEPNDASAEAKHDTILSPGGAESDQQAQYFERYGLKPLIQSIISMIQLSSLNPTERARPLRMCLSLMDRWEIGGLVVPQIFAPALRSVWTYQREAPSNEAFAEVLRSGSMFFDAVESSLIWTETFKVLDQAMNSKADDTSGAEDLLEMILLVTTRFNIREEDMLMVHIPIVSLILLLRLETMLQGVVITGIGRRGEVARLALKILTRLVEITPPEAFNEATGEASSLGKRNSVVGSEVPKNIQKLEQFYLRDEGSLDNVGPPISAEETGDLMIDTAIMVIADLVNSEVSPTLTEIGLAVFDTILRRVNMGRASEKSLAYLRLSLDEDLADEKNLSPHSSHFAKIAAKISTLTIICSEPDEESRLWISETVLFDLIPTLITAVWPYLSPSKPEHNVEAVRCVWRLQSIDKGKQTVQSTVSSLMAPPIFHKSFTSDVEALWRFFNLWNHSPTTSSIAQGRSPMPGHRRESSFNNKSLTEGWLPMLGRPLMFVLDVLEHPRNTLFTHVKMWLESLHNPNLILEFLISQYDQLLLEPSDASRQKAKHESEGEEEKGRGDIEIRTYLLQKVSDVIQHSPGTIWSTLSNPSKSSHLRGQISTTLDLVIEICAELIQLQEGQPEEEHMVVPRNLQTASSLLQQILLGPAASLVLQKELEVSLIDQLLLSIQNTQISRQVCLIELISTMLAARFSNANSHATTHLPPAEVADTSPANSNAATNDSTRSNWLMMQSIASKLMQCLKLGLTTRSCWPVLDSWSAFLRQCLPLYGDNVFQVLIPLVESLCKVIAEVFGDIMSVFESSSVERSDLLEPSLALLLNVLEQSLAIGHGRLVNDELLSPPVKAPEVPQGFFGTMVSGVFTSDTTRTKTMTANNRLTVLLCFKDAVRICFSIWSWGDTKRYNLPIRQSTWASFHYMTLRLRNRTRHIFEHLFAAEALESLETLVELWCNARSPEDQKISNTIFNLLHVLDGSGPKTMIPAIFNAMYSRTNPGVLDPSQKSTLTSTLTDVDLSVFLVAYTRSLEDDIMAEIWADCIAFLRDVLANPLPNRQTLPKLIEFTSVIGQKVDNTTFGEQRRLRRELSDVFLRLLAATLTIKPMGHDAAGSSSEKGQPGAISVRGSLDSGKAASSEGLIPVLAALAPNLSKILVESDRITTIVTTISTLIIVPTFRSRSFPENISKQMLELVHGLSKVPEAAKLWRKDVLEAFNDAKFFFISFDLVESDLLPILSQWVLTERDRLTEILSKLPAPTSAGLMFGVGATSARLDADRKAQLNLRRIAVLIVAAPNDNFILSLAALQEKMVDLLSTTATSSPSYHTRAEIYLVFRALVLKVSPAHLASFWPMINSELQDALSSAFPGDSGSKLNTVSLLQACKLLDVLLTLNIDDFQLQEWLFITDTTDAVYPSDYPTTSLVDDLKNEIGAKGDAYRLQAAPLVAPSTGQRRPLLHRGLMKDLKETGIKEVLLRPFFRQLSIYAFESNYSMEAPDLKFCLEDLVADVFDESTFV